MKRSRVGFLFILPWLIGLILFTTVPLMAALFIGFTDWNIAGNANWIGLDNYIELFQEDAFWNAMW